MGNERNPEVQPKQPTREQDELRKPPNPAEDLSIHGRQGEPVVYGPDGSGEAPETDSDMQPMRGAD
jgi:hypothetical protein